MIGINIITPLFHGQDYLHIALNSLLEQEFQDFVVTLINDDGEDYDDIIAEFKRKGLAINYINDGVHRGQGLARQMGIDSRDDCKYILFLDQDDEFEEDGIDLLWNEAESYFSDIVYSKFTREMEEYDITVDLNGDIYTQLHGKLFSYKYIKSINLKFSENLKYAEDAYFNMIAFYGTENSRYLDKLTYRWRYNEKSQTRDNEIEYYCNMYPDFIEGQIEGLEKIYELNMKIEDAMVLGILFQIYYIVMIERNQNFTSYKYKDALKRLGTHQYIKDIMAKEESLVYSANMLKGAIIFSGKPIFFNYKFTDWVNEWLEKEEE